MQRPMEGVRVLEVAQFTFVPAAGAVLADWGAEVDQGRARRDAATPSAGWCKRARPRRPQPGLLVRPDHGGPQPRQAQHRPGAGQARRPGRCSRTWSGAATSSSRTSCPARGPSCGIDVDDVRAINPDIIYVRGSGFGARGPGGGQGRLRQHGVLGPGRQRRRGHPAGRGPAGPDADRCLRRLHRRDDDRRRDRRGAVRARATTGETSVVDVSLLGVGAWATQFAVNLALMAGGPLPATAAGRSTARRPTR